MPIPLEFIFIVPVGECVQLKWFGVVRLAQHLGRQHLVHLEAVAIVNLSAFDKTFHIFRVSPQQKPSRATIPHAPMNIVLLGVTQQIRIAVAAIPLILRIDMCGVKGHAQLFHPILGRYPKR